MSFDPFADPWGAAMLGCVAIAALSLLLWIGAAIARRLALVPRLLLGLSLLGFLGSAGGGTWMRLNAPESESESEPETEPESGPAATPEPGAKTDNEGSPEKADTGGAVAKTNTEAKPEEVAEAAPEAEPAEDTAEGTAEEAIAGDETPEAHDGDTAPGQPPPPTPAADLPDDPAQRRTAVRVAIREIRKTALDQSTCVDGAALSAAWIKLKSLPKDEYRPQQEALARRLERCRLKVRWTTAYALQKKRVAERKDAAKSIATRLGEQGEINVFASVSGVRSQRLRFGSPGLTEQMVSGWMASGQSLPDELENAGFDKVVFSDGETAWRHDLEPTSDDDLVRVDLESFGLADKLVLPE